MAGFGPRAVEVAVLTAVVGMAGGCAWNTTDKALGGSLVVLQAADLWETSYIDGEVVREGNPIFAEPDGRPNMAAATAFKVVGTGLILAISDHDKEARRGGLILVNVLQGAVVAWNAVLLISHWDELHDKRPEEADSSKPPTLLAVGREGPDHQTWTGARPPRSVEERPAATSLRRREEGVCRLR